GVQFTAAGRGGMYTPDEMVAAIHPRAHWTPRTSLVAVENTHNRSGGRVWPQVQASAVAGRARALGLATHLDGARVWNASVASGVGVAEICAPFDTVSVCFSKGLGAPVGSAFCATSTLVEEARRLRKRWGGGMRQVGVVAAAALYALTHHRDRLAEDHANAQAFAHKLSGVRGVLVDRAAVETNIVNIDLDVPAEKVARAAREAGVLISPTGPNRLRAVTHLDVSRADVNAAAEILSGLIATLYPAG
ncbi:MAG TPA: GntG family PLP-dependent aldolase, partial [Polyangiaceae bacterium]|nr:GntG family PLP-dependent aldolase [Polyangiaceae bacterium]